MRRIEYVLIVCVCTILLGCAESTNSTVDEFDRKAMLQNIASTLILPGYDSLVVASKEMQEAVLLFSTTPNTSTLTTAKIKWKNCILHFQDVVAFDFGPADGLFGSLSENISTFPTHTDHVESAIAKSDTLLQNFQRDARGLFCIEYLLFAQDESSTISAYSSIARAGYLRAVTTDVHKHISEVQSGWKTAYAEKFVENSGTDAGSSVSYLFNNMITSYENIKNYKLGIPLGKRVGQAGVEPMLVEAVYSGISVELIQRHFDAIMSIWYGKSKNSASGNGFREYLKTVEGGLRLVTETEAQEQNIRVSLAALPLTPLSKQIQTSPTQAEALYTEMQKMTRFLKSELSSLLGIAITYSSGDGD